MTNTPPPIQQGVIDQSGLPTLPWILFFNQSFEGDSGVSFDPTFQNLTEVGGDATITGRYYQLSQYLVYFRIVITPVTNTSSTAGTTYCDNFPLNFTANGFNLVVTDTAGGSIGVNNASNNRIYIPSWTSVTSTLTILGIGEAR